MTVSGLNRLDGESLAGRGTDRRVAQDAVGAAHHLLTAASVAVSVVVAAAGLVLVARPGWSTGLGAAVAVTVACRARLAPLVPARWAMLTAALVVAVGWSSGATAGAPAVVAVALAVVGVGVVGAVWPPPPYVLARLRRLVDALELVAVLVLVPLLLASAGVFSDLLATW